MWERGLQPAALPQSDDAQAGQLAQARVAHERAREQRVADRQLGDLHAVERADDVRLGAAGIHAVGKRLAELAFQRQHRRGAAELKDVDRVVLLDDGGDVHVRRDLTDGQRDVRVDRVLTVGDDQPRVGVRSRS